MDSDFLPKFEDLMCVLNMKKQQHIFDVVIPVFLVKAKKERSNSFSSTVFLKVLINLSKFIFTLNLLINEQERFLKM